MTELKYIATEVEAANEIGVTVETIRRMRFRGEIPDYCYTKFGYKQLKYCMALLVDWQQNPDDTESHNRIREQIQLSRIGNIKAA